MPPLFKGHLSSNECLKGDEGTKHKSSKIEKVGARDSPEFRGASHLGVQVIHLGGTRPSQIRDTNLPSERSTVPQNLGAHIFH